MTAVEKALRHIEQLQKRLIKAVPPKPRKAAKRRTAPKKKPDQKKPRARLNRRGKTISEPHNPPVTHPDVTELEQTFAPAPTPPEVEGPITPAFRPLVEVTIDETVRDALERGAGLKPTRPSWADAFERDIAAFSRNAPKPVEPPAPRVVRPSCKVVDLRTGLTCKLGAHSGDEHGHERGRFHLVAAPGQHVRRAVDEAAWGTQEVSL